MFAGLRRLYGRIIINPNKPLPAPVPNPIIWVYNRFFHKLYERKRLQHIENAVILARKNYSAQIERIRGKVSRNEKVRVLFIVNELAKWKASSLYFTLMRHPLFDPLIGLGCPLDVIGSLPSLTDANIKNMRMWFEVRGYKCVNLYDALKDRILPIEQYKPDVVFYPEVWYNFAAHAPDSISRFALTCYIPYFVPNYVDVFLDCQQDMHRLYWRHFVLNEELAKLYDDATCNRVMAGKFVGLGHTMFDEIKSSIEGTLPVEGRKCIIYAPHWTFNHPNNPSRLHYSTFSEFGNEILQYAQNHREFHWVFKPHPGLYDKIVQSGLMSKSDVDDYYKAWSDIGSVALMAGYAELFAKSYAMITDCGSFLSEYGSTGRPIIHLISPKNDRIPPPVIKRVYDTYYQVRNLMELRAMFKMVLEEGLDPNKEVRFSAIKEAGFCGQDAAKNILDYLLNNLQKF